METNQKRPKNKHYSLTPLVSVIINLLYVFICYQICRTLFMIVNHNIFEGTLTIERLLRIYRGGIVFDLSAIAYTNVLYILLVLLPLHWKEKKLYTNICKWLFVSVNTFAITANFIDTVYFQYSMQRATVAVFTQFSNETNVFKVIMIEVVNHWYLLLCAAAMCWALARLYVKPDVSSKSLKRYYTEQILSMLVIAPFVVWAMRGAWFITGSRPITMANAREYVDITEHNGIVLNTPFSMLRTYLTKAPVPKIPQFYTETAQLEKYYSPIHYPDTIGKEMNKKNVVILMVESFAQEFVGALNTNLDNGTYKGYTPFFDSLLKQSVYFEDMMCNARMSIDAMPAVLAGIPKFGMSFILSPYSINDFTSIATLLNPEGYHSAFFHGAYNGSMGFDAFAKAGDFKEYYGRNEYCEDSRFGGMADDDGTWGIWDEEFLQFFCEKTSEFPQPFVSVVFTLSSHHPFAVPERYKDVFTDEGIYPLHKCIKYTDNALKLFFESASKKPWYNNTIFIITADHASSKTTHPEYKMGAGDFRIPIAIFDPSGELIPGQREGVFQQIDIIPTLMGILEYNKPYFAYGKDVLNTKAEDSWGFYYHDEPILIKQDKMLILDRNNDFAAKSLTDIHTDPLLQHNLVGEDPELTDSLSRQFKAILQSMYQTMKDNQMQYSLPEQ